MITSGYNKIELAPSEFRILSEFILNNYGINLTKNKKELLEYRLSKRLRDLNMNSYQAYLNYLFSEEGSQSEPQLLINEVSTNKTSFFREAEHFRILIESILPSLSKLYKSTSMPVWSAGCSSGEEAYSMAICFEKYRLTHPGFNYQILGTDVSETALIKARKAIYSFDSQLNIPGSDLKRFFLKSKDSTNPKVRVIKGIRDKVRFDYLNLMDSEYKTPYLYPVIFCRNTLIYFNQETKKAILQKLRNRLKPGGYLFISHTESLVHMDQSLKLVYPSVYQHIENQG